VGDNEGDDVESKTAEEDAGSEIEEGREDAAP